jgi:hypothetical protein
MKHLFKNTRIKRSLLWGGCMTAVVAGIGFSLREMKPGLGLGGDAEPKQTVRIGGMKVEAMKIDPAQRQRVMAVRQPAPAPVELWDTSGKGAEEVIAADFLEKGPYEQRARQLRRQTLQWNAETAQSLYGYLLRPDNLPGIPSMSSHALKNEIMDYAVEKDPDAGGVAGLFLAAHQTSGQAPLIRDYLIQHLDGLYLRLEREGVSARKKQVEALLWKTAGPKREFESATALMALDRIARADRAFAAENKGRLERGALALLNHAQAEDADKVTALQVALRLESPAVLPAARKIAQAGTSSVALKASALGVLGRQGGREDAGWLEKLAGDKQSPVNTVAQYALEQLKKRLNS